ncbi:MAG TPA: methyltransferase domain-containing protein [Myxococcales bacterium]|jgi:ubiquinone/menaquinone biosynthesis C-methylase UbiE
MEHVCPWWFGTLLASRVRKLVQDPAKILSPFVTAGATVLEPGPGMGFFTVELARLVGPQGKVVAVDLQQPMLDGVRARAAKDGLAERLVLRKVEPTSLGVSDLAGQVDFALLFWMLHEVPDQPRFLGEMAQALKPGGKLLFCEPKGHVSGSAFEKSLALAGTLGLRAESRPRIRLSRAALLVR